MNPLLIRRRGMMAGKTLPYDAEIEYIESTGTQWIDTGVAPVNIGKLSSNFMPFSTGNYSTFSGARNGNNDPGSLQIRVGNASKLVYIGANSGNNNAPFVFSTWNSVELTAGQRDIVINGSTITLSTVSALTCTIDMPIPGLRTSETSISQILHCRIKSYAIWNVSNTPVRDLIPVRVGTVGYMYDRVSGQLFGNAGTGSFVLGPDIQ